MKIIGITGPTGAGKTTALRALAELGAEILDCDAVYHELLETGAPLRSALTERFGTGILDQTGKIDRKQLGNIVFQNAEALADLDRITHRFILAELDRRIDRAAEEGRPAVAIDAIALIESGIGERCDAVVCVLAPEEVRVRRIMAREGVGEDYARRRVAAQKGEEFFRAHADCILENSGAESREEFAARARSLFEELLRKP